MGLEALGALVGGVGRGGAGERLRERFRVVRESLGLKPDADDRAILGALKSRDDIVAEKTAALLADKILDAGGVCAICQARRGRRCADCQQEPGGPLRSVG